MLSGADTMTPMPTPGSEEGRGGEEGRFRGVADHLKKKKDIPIGKKERKVRQEEGYREGSYNERKDYKQPERCQHVTVRRCTRKQARERNTRDSQCTDV